MMDLHGIILIVTLHTGCPFLHRLTAARRREKQIVTECCATCRYFVPLIRCVDRSDGAPIYGYCADGEIIPVPIPPRGARCADWEAARKRRGGRR